MASCGHASELPLVFLISITIDAVISGGRWRTRGRLNVVSRLRYLAKRPADDQRVRFLIVGGINTVVAYGLFVLIELAFGRWIGYLGSLYISYALGVTSAFFLHRRPTFRAQESEGSQRLAFMRFASVYVVSLAINTIGLPVIVEMGHTPPIGAQAIMVVVTTLISYVGHSYFSFRPSR